MVFERDQKLNVKAKHLKQHPSFKGVFFIVVVVVVVCLFISSNCWVLVSFKTQTLFFHYSERIFLRRGFASELAYNL